MTYTMCGFEYIYIGHMRSMQQISLSVSNRDSYICIIDYIWSGLIRVHHVLLDEGLGTILGRQHMKTTLLETYSIVHPFGDVHLVSSIEGIGPEYTEQLEKLGIEDTKQLWMASAKHIAEHIGASEQTVRHWQNRAELMAVSGIGKQYAELLERSGIRTIGDLAESKTKTLLRKVDRKQRGLGHYIQGNALGEAVVSSWIAAAIDHQSRMRAET